MKIAFTILGECESMKNRRIPKPVIRDGKPGVMWIKSKEAQAYETSVMKQVPPAARQQLMGPVRMTLHMYYATTRRDMDEALLLDCLQNKSEIVKKLVRIARGNYEERGQRVLKFKGVYVNDNQVKERHVYWHLDPRNPRVEVEVEPLEMQQAELIGDSDMALDEEADETSDVPF